MNKKTNIKSNKKYIGKNVIKMLLVSMITIVIMIIISIGIKRCIYKQDFIEISEAQEKYYNSLESKSIDTQEYGGGALLAQLVVASGNQTRYNRIASIGKNSTQKIVATMQTYEVADIAGENGSESDSKSAKSKAEEIASQITCLDTYIKDTLDSTKEEKLAYLMNAEVVTKFPYIEQIANDESKLNGTVRFYRHVNPIEEGAQEEEYYLTYIEEQGFEELKKQYEQSGNKEVYKYFTIDENNDVIIAYGRRETRTITTDDAEVTLDVINEKSSEIYSASGDGTYSTTKYTIRTRSIDYQSQIEQYVLPFNFLASLLVQTKDYNLVKEIADLAYNSEIRIGIYDNESVTNQDDVYTYKKAIKYTENTQLHIENINIDPSIENVNFSNIVTSCFGSIESANTDSPQANHFTNTGNNNSTDGNIYNTYVESMDSNGVITSTSSAGHSFVTTLNTYIVSNSTPTTGVELADIWAGKWVAIYNNEAKNNSQNSSETLDNEQFQYISGNSNKFSEALFKADAGEIGANLYEHTNKIIEDAIEKIIAQMDFTTSASITWQDIIDHAPNCNTCKSYLNVYFPSKDWTNTQVVSAEELVNAVNTSPRLQIVKDHIEAILQQSANANSQATRQKFEQDLRNELNNNYEQFVTAYKANIEINSAMQSLTTTSTYKKDSTEMENAGEALKKIFSKAKYYKDREALLMRSEWFWECIRLNDDTEKIENLLRYLFNIAFDTDQFGTFTEEEIQNLFEVFEPQEIKKNGIIFGGTIQEKVWFSLIQEGYTEVQVAGVMGCIYSESKFDPLLIEGGSGAGFGLCQWSFSRREGLEAYAASKNVSPSDIQTQIEFLITELTTDGSGPASEYTTCGFMKYKGYSRDDWINAETPEDAAIAFCWSFERPWDDADETERQEKAREYYEQFQGRKLIANNVVEFALQFEGLRANEIQPIDGDLPYGLFSYKTSDGVQFELQAWCADFVSFCFDQCGQLDSIGGTFQAPWKRIEQLKNGTINGIFIDGGEIPQPGDIFLTEGHTGIVVEVQGDTLITIEGNCGGTGKGDAHSRTSYVKKYSYRTIYDNDIIGYQRPMQ